MAVFIFLLVIDGETSSASVDALVYVVMFSLVMDPYLSSSSHSVGRVLTQTCWHSAAPTDMMFSDTFIWCIFCASSIRSLRNTSLLALYPRHRFPSHHSSVSFHPNCVTSCLSVSSSFSYQTSSCSSLGHLLLHRSAWLAAVLSPLL